jgi:hypothetical protein
MVTPRPLFTIRSLPSSMSGAMTSTSSFATLRIVSRRCRLSTFSACRAAGFGPGIPEIGDTATAGC